MELSREARIAAAYDRVLRGAVVEQPDLRGRTLTIRIDGITYSRRVAVMTVDGLKAACASALADHCAVRAAVAVYEELVAAGEVVS